MLWCEVQYALGLCVFYPLRYEYAAMGCVNLDIVEQF